MPTRLKNETIFAERTPATAYWAGFLMADGNVYPRPDSGSYRISMTLKSEDADHLMAFKSFVGTENEIRHLSRQDGVAISFDSRIMGGDLEWWGVVPRKTYVGRIPDHIPADLMPHFMRGLIDGDGSVKVGYTQGKEKWNVELTNNLPVITAAKSVFAEIGVTARSILKRRNEENGHETHFMYIGGKVNVQRALGWLAYESDLPALHRKRETAIRLIETSVSELCLKRFNEPLLLGVGPA